MAWSRIQSVSKAATATAVSSVSQAYTTSNLSSGTKLIVLVVTSTQTGTTTTVASVKDAALNSFTLVGRKSQPSSGTILTDVSLWAMDTPAGDVASKPTITATLSGGTANMAILLQEVSGLATGNTTAAMVDGTLAGLSGSGSSGSTGSPSYTSTASSEYLVSCYGDDGGPLTWTKPSALTSDTNSENTQSFANIALAFGNSTNGAEAGSWAITGSAAEWATVLVAFQLPSSGSSVSGAVATAAITAPAGSVSASPTVTGAVATAALAAPAGAVTASSSVPGAVATLALAAAAGGVAAGEVVAGVTATLALAAPAGSLHITSAVTGTVATAALAAHAGTATPSNAVPGAVATAALAAPAGSVHITSTVTGVVATLALAAPAGSVPVPVTATFPNAPLGATVELDLAGTWTDISSYVAYKKALLQISRGHPDESTNTNPSSMAAVLDNIDKRFTSKNPLGAYYGLIGRNTPVRVSIPEAAPYLRIEGDNTSYAQAPDTAGLSITGDMDVQLDVTLDNWRGDQILAAKWAETGNERSWVFYLQGGVLHFGFSTNGTGVDSTNSSEFGGAGSVPVPPLRRQGLRVTFASSTGTVKFYTSPSPLSSAVWTQLGDTSSFGSASIFNGTAPVQVGYCSDAASVGVLGIYGQVHELIILSGIGGTVKGDANFALATAGASTYTDAQANVWTCEGTSEISARKYRFHGEASSWTPYSEGTTGLDLWCGLDAGGLLRRIQQNTQTLGSAFTRALPSAIALVGYWPCEDGNSTSSGATPATPTQFASAIPTNPAGTFAFGPPQFASDSNFLCSQSLPVINGSRWRFRLPARSADTANIYRFLLSMPATSDTNGGVIARMYTAGTIQRLDLVYSTGGGLTLNGYDATPTLLFSIGPDAFGTDGTPMWVSLELQTSGSSVQYSVVTLTPGAATGFAMTGTLSSASIGNATLIDVNETGALQGTAVGQVTYQSEWESLYDFATQLDAYQGETAGNRFARLCAEEGIPFRSVGSLDDTVVMGAQTPVAFSALLQECVDADTGQMFEPRQALALGYRTRRSMENQGAGIALDYSLDGYAGFLTPTEDDQYTKNDVTATRAYAAGGGTGSSSEAVISEGPLSVQPPPDGVGPYLDSVTVNVDLDAQLQDIASWHAWLGSVDQPRYPAIPYDLARTDIGANLYAVPDLDLGDRLTIGNPPAWEPPDGISQLVQQITETIGELSYSIAWTGVPEQPYELAIADDPVYGRADSPDSTLAAPVTATAGYAAIPCASSYPALVSGATHNLTGGFLSAMMVPSQGSDREMFLELSAGSSNKIDMYYSGGTLGARLTQAGVVTNVGSTTYNPGTHAFWRIVEFSGTIFWDASPDGVTWANLWSHTYTLTITALTVVITSGYFSTDTATTSYAAAVRGILADDFGSNDLATTWSASTGSPSIVTGASLLLVAAGPSGELWTTSAGNLPFDVELGGERITVTNITSAASPQVFTATRSVNGVVKAQTAGESVSLFFPSIAAL